MRALRNEETDTWHLTAARGCGAEPADQTVTGTWAEIRDTVERSSATKCRNCNWPRG